MNHLVKLSFFLSHDVPEIHNHHDSTVVRLITTTDHVGPPCWLEPQSHHSVGSANSTGKIFLWGCLYTPLSMLSLNRCFKMGKAKAAHPSYVWFTGLSAAPEQRRWLKGPNIWTMEQQMGPSVLKGLQGDWICRERNSQALLSKWRKAFSVQALRVNVYQVSVTIRNIF